MEYTKEVMLSELERRTAILQKLMEENGLDGLFFTSTAQQAYQLAVKYTSGYTLSSRRDVATMRRGELPYLIVPTVGQQSSAQKVSFLPPENILWGDLIQTAHDFARSFSASKPRIGLYEPLEIPAGIDGALRSSGAEFVDITALFTAARQEKSEFEVECTKAASDVAVRSFEHVVKLIAPGKTECEIVGAAEGFVRANGGEDTLILVRAQKPHTFISRAYNRPIAEDGVFVYSVEMAGAHGYWTQCVRPIFMKRGCQPEAYRILGAIKEAEAAGVEQMKIGNRICDVAQAIEDVIAAKGLKMGVWSGHGMGADLGDGVDIGTSNKMKIVPNMVLTIHPSVMSDEDGLLYGNTWLATENGPVCLTPQYTETPYLEDLKAIIK